VRRPTGDGVSIRTDTSQAKINSRVNSGTSRQVGVDAEEEPGFADKWVMLVRSLTAYILDRIPCAHSQAISPTTPTMRSRTGTIRAALRRAHQG
jgi:hypothetical protein